MFIISTIVDDFTTASINRKITMFIVFLLMPLSMAITDHYVPHVSLQGLLYAAIALMTYAVIMRSYTLDKKRTMNNTEQTSLG